MLIARGIVHARMGVNQWNAQAIVERRTPRDIATMIQTGTAEYCGPFIWTEEMDRDATWSNRLRPFIDASQDIAMKDPRIIISTHDGVTTLNIPGIADTLLANLPGRPLTDLVEIEVTGHADIDEAVASIRITDARSFGSAAQFNLSPAPVSYAPAQCAATTLFQALIQVRAGLQPRAALRPTDASWLTPAGATSKKAPSMTIADESAKCSPCAAVRPASEAPVTRLWIFSDLHLELARWELPATRPECDVIVAAGDIHSPASQTIRWLAEHADGVPVITVPGNHEWYAPNRTFNVEDERRRAADLAANLGVHLLMDAEAIVHGVRFLGTTLWTDYALHDDVRHGMKVAERAMNDHRCIYPTPGMTLLRAEDARQWHHRARSWLAERLAEPSPHPTVVVTHHLPHPRSIARQFAGDPLNVAFCSDLSSLVENSGAALWVHGHTHTSCGYLAGGTRVVCNPKGYGPTGPDRRIENAAFDPALVIAV